MLVISIIYIFMIKRRKYIILDLSAPVGGDFCRLDLVLVCKSSRSGETFIGQDGGGEPTNSRWSFDRSSFLTGQCSSKWNSSNRVILIRYLSVELFMPGISALHHDPCASRPTHRGLLAGPCKQSAPAMTEIDMSEKKEEEEETSACVGSLLASFNPCSLGDLRCFQATGRESKRKNTIKNSWKGTLVDCDCAWRGHCTLCPVGRATGPGWCVLKEASWLFMKEPWLQNTTSILFHLSHQIIFNCQCSSVMFFFSLNQHRVQNIMVELLSILK